MKTLDIKITGRALTLTNDEYNDIKADAINTGGYELIDGIKRAVIESNTIIAMQINNQFYVILTPIPLS